MTTTTLRSIQYSVYPTTIAAVYFSFLILVATLAPFDFQWLGSRSFPVVRFYLADVAQNILLFLPLGAVFAQRREINLLGAVLLGAAFSAAIEFAQLSVIGRTSNVVDVLTNSMGAAAGWLYGSYLMRDRVLPATDLTLAFMLLPLCWVLAMRSASQDFMIWLALPAILAGLALFKRAILHLAFRPFHLGLWAVMALVPLVYATRSAVIAQVSGFGVTSGFAVAILTAFAALFLPVERLERRVLLALLCVLLVAIILVDAMWFFSRATPVQWTAAAHLHWADAVTCAVCVVCFWTWTRASEI